MDGFAWCVCQPFCRTVTESTPPQWCWIVTEIVVRKSLTLILPFYSSVATTLHENVHLNFYTMSVLHGQKLTNAGYW